MSAQSGRQLQQAPIIVTDVPWTVLSQLSQQHCVVEGRPAALLPLMQRYVQVAVCVDV
jgi:hypothetical protein